MESETTGLKQVLSHSRRIRAISANQWACEIGEVRIIIDVSGMGRDRCRKTTNKLIDQGASWIVCAGFAAALDDKARAGDVVVVDRVMHARRAAAPIACSGALVAAIPPSGKLGYTIWRSDMVTCDAMVLRASAKRDIYGSTGAASLDMEAHAAADVCDQRGVPFVVVKGISDTADQDLPDEVQSLALSKSWTEKLGIVIGRPGIWPDLWRLRNSTALASSNLGDVLGTMLLRLFG